MKLINVSDSTSAIIKPPIVEWCDCPPYVFCECVGCDQSCRNQVPERQPSSVERFIE